MRTSFSGFFAAALLAVSLAATASGSAQTVNSCQLLNQHDAAALFGSPLQPPIDVGTMCMYTNASGPVVTITVAPAAGSAGPDFVKAKMGVGQGDTVELVPGLGNQNLFDMRPNGTNVLTVFFHQKMVILSVQKHMDARLKASMIQAASQIVGKI